MNGQIVSKIEHIEKELEDLKTLVKKNQEKTIIRRIHSPAFGRV